MDYADNPAKNVRDHIPLEQGLRLNINSYDEFVKFVRDHIPLEQGLRLDTLNKKLDGTGVRDHIPLEQGLRPRSSAMASSDQPCQRPYSIRTRIKTNERTI